MFIKEFLRGFHLIELNIIKQKKKTPNKLWFLGSISISLFNDISSFVGNLMSKRSLMKISNDAI